MTADIDMKERVELATPAKPNENAKPTAEIGESGLLHFHGQIEEAYIRELRYPQAYAKLNEIRRRDPTIASLANAVKLLSHTAIWSVEPAGSSDVDKRAAEFLEQSLADMSLTIQDAVEDFLSALWFGWSWSEIVYKRRKGPGSDPASKYDDGGIGWRKWAPRRQSTFYRWEFDDTDTVQGLWQMTRNGKQIYLPIKKSLHFTPDRDMGNPEGMSVLEPVYESWHYVKNLQIINGMGFERAFVGLPVFEYAEDYTPTEEDRKLVAAIGRALRVDEKAWVGVPAGVKFRLETVTNSNATSLLDAIKQYRIWMLMVVMADFMALGVLSSGGSYSLGQDKSELFLMAVDGWLDKIAHPDNLGILNRYAVPRLFAYNSGFDGMTDYPRIKHSSVQKPNLPALADFLSALYNFILPDPNLEKELRSLANLPPPMASTTRYASRDTQADNPEDKSQEETEEPEESPETGDEAVTDAELARRRRYHRGLQPRGMGYFELQFHKSLREFKREQRQLLVQP